MSGGGRAKSGKVDGSEWIFLTLSGPNRIGKEYQGFCAGSGGQGWVSVRKCRAGEEVGARVLKKQAGNLKESIPTLSQNRRNGAK